MIPISLVTFEHAISNFQVDIPEFQRDLRVAVWNATQIVMGHIKKPDVEDIPSEWLFDDIPDGVPLEEDFIPVLPAAYSTESPQVQKFVILPGNILAAIMLVAGELFEQREAGIDSFGHGANPISDAIVDLLVAFRDPTMA